MDVTLTRVRGALFEGSNASGQKCLIDGPPELGGQGEGIRPMEMVLVSLAGCSALDVLHIVEKQQKEPIEGLSVRVQGVRADAVPAVFTSIELRFEATGAIDAHKLQRAVALSMEKYCSVAKMLAPTVAISFTTAVLQGTDA
jgi:putative redox protein